MKHYLCLLMLAMVAVLGTSCKTQAQFGVDYAVIVQGDGDGVVDVMFPQGRFEMDGTADIVLRASSDSAVINAPVVTKAQVIESGDPAMLKALKDANDYVQNEFYAAQTDAGGTYYLLLKGYVRERLTGLGFEVEKVLTNRPPNTANGPKRAESNLRADPYPFIK